jgi:hypothetical protein
MLGLQVDTGKQDSEESRRNHVAEQIAEEVHKMQLDEQVEDILELALPLELVEKYLNEMQV